MKMEFDPNPIRLSEWGSLHLTPLWAYRGKPAMSRQSSGITPGTTAWLIETGSVQIHMGSNHFSATAGDWVLVPRGALRFEFSEGASILSIHYIAQWMSGRPLFEHETPLVVSPSIYPQLARAGVALQQFVFRHFPTAGTKLLQHFSDLNTYLRLQGLMIRWMLALSDTMTTLQQQPTGNQPMDPRVTEARRIIDMQIATEPFVERELPKRLSISASHLDRLFLSELGITPRVYADKARLNVACHYLANTTDLSKQIAMRLGFSQPSHFTRWFRSHTKLTPQAYRRYRSRQPGPMLDVPTPTYLISQGIQTETKPTP